MSSAFFRLKKNRFAEKGGVSTILMKRDLKKIGKRSDLVIVNIAVCASETK